MQFLSAYIMKGRMQAIIVASTLALLTLIIPPLSVVSSATIALVTLRLGGRQGLYVLLGSSVAVAALSVFILGSIQVALVYGLLIGLMVWLPVWLIALVLRESRQLVLALEIAVLLGIVAVIGFYMYQPEPAKFWSEVFKVMLSLLLQNQPDMPAEVLQNSADAFAPYMTGMMAAGAVFSLLLGLFLARLWQSNLYNPGGFKTEFLALKGNTYLAVATVLMVAVSYIADLELCWNILVVLIVFYASLGSAVLHSLISTLKGSQYWLLIFYMVLFFSLKFMALIAFCGLIDTWMNLRNKFKPKGA
jgi:hypothetical protein